MQQGRLVSHRIQHEGCLSQPLILGMELVMSLWGWDPAPYPQSAPWDSAGEVPDEAMALRVPLHWMFFLEMLWTWTIFPTQGDRNFCG